MLNNNDTITDYKNHLKSRQETLKAMESLIFNTRKEEFVAAGGCTNCWGHGTVCVWGTMDSMSGGYDEFGPCGKCGEVEREDPKDPTRVTKRLKNGPEMPWAGVNKNRLSGHPHLNSTPLVVTEDEKADLELAQRDVQTAEEMLSEAETAYEIIKGSKVKVVRGRKTPKGTEGTVFWMGEGRTYSFYDQPKTRVGIKTDDGVTYWVNDIDYLELLNPRTKEQLDAEHKAERLTQCVRGMVGKGSEIVSERVSGLVAWAGYTKRGNGPWRALVKADTDFWLDASEISQVNGASITA